ncbi:hypothetical protein [Roseicella aquatilis]|uniref:Uncharacterized protein n=1 Tax=Roseicella aquatilis TaxID=2527868 RepID=A0A4R4DUH7_9PROT|nr:hypothetical protein [Roseicella aquatilis]TCZ65907.1 hypothetical protein EXY23_02140 [Roseicella aquatilis]
MVTQDAEWDAVWAEYDQHAHHAPAGPVATPALPTRRGHRRAALLALLTLVPLLILVYAMRAVPAESGREAAPTSLSPVEAELPPLSAAISRLAAESATAACWAMQLRPQGGDCPQPTR